MISGQQRTLLVNVYMGEHAQAAPPVSSG